jgi:hypothetical protein
VLETEFKGAHPASILFNGLAGQKRRACPRRTEKYNVFQLLICALAQVLYLDVQTKRQNHPGNSPN